jgi:hypothetical protein
MKYAIWFWICLMTTIPAWAQTADSLTVNITFDRTGAEFAAVFGADSQRVAFQFGEVRKESHQILIRDRVLVSQDTLFIGSLAVSLDEMTPSDVVISRRECRVTLSKQETANRSRRGLPRNRYSSFRQLTIPADDFVRGDALAIGEEIVVDGEVNGNVVAIFGDVKLASTAVCQRDVVAIGGDVSKHRTARVSGAYQSSDSWRQTKSRRHHGANADRSAVQLGLAADYNRVDGFTLMPEIHFQSDEKFVPKFTFRYGYGFASKRSQYQLGIEQKLFDVNHTTLGGSVHRLTKTEDNWVSDSGENCGYAILLREDFRDYYSGEGGDIYVEQNLGFAHTFRLTYSYEELEWLPAHTGLWSLFGGDKRFRGNFSSVAAPLRDAGLGDYRNSEAIFQANYVFNTVEDERGELSRAGWVGAIQYQHSSESIGSDFDFDRYTIELRRYQPLTYRQNFNVRLLYGGATGELPLHRLFYLGGIRTLRGYDIKQFYGSRVALANCEYVVNFPRTDIALSLLLDIGKTGWDSDFLSKGEWRGDVGIGMQFDKWLRLELTRQINGCTDKLQISGLIGRSF